MSRPRNNLTKLPKAIRLRICALLEDGAEYDAVRNDPEVAEACAAAGLTLHNGSILAYRSGAEYDEYHKLNLPYRDKAERRGIAAAMVTGDGIIHDQVDLAAYLLTEKTLEMLQAEGAQFESKDLAALARSVKDAGSQIWQKKEAALLEKHAAEVTDYQSKIAELSAQVAAQAERIKNLAGNVDGAAVADALNKKLGLDT